MALSPIPPKRRNCRRRSLCLFKLLAALGQHGLPVPATLPAKWVAHCTDVGDGRKVLVYLGRYLYRGVIQERDIIACDATHVTYRWRDAKTRAMKTRTVTGAMFLWLVLRHVLPRGMRRARNHGFLHPNSMRAHPMLRLLVLRPSGPQADAPTPRPRWVCRCCGAPMVIVRRRVTPTAGAPPGPAADATT